jgi:hypothetical protein
VPRGHPHGRDLEAVGAKEAGLAGGGEHKAVAALVQQATVEAAHQHQVGEPGLPAPDPVDDVVGVAKAARPAAGPAAGLVPGLERPPHSGRDAAGAGGGVRHLPTPGGDRGHGGVAGDVAGGLGGQHRALPELAAGPAPRRQGVGVDLHHDLIGLRLPVGGPRRLRHLHQGVGAQLLAGGWLSPGRLGLLLLRAAAAARRAAATSAPSSGVSRPRSCRKPWSSK